MTWTEQSARRWLAGSWGDGMALALRAMTWRSSRAIEWHEGRELPARYRELPLLTQSRGVPPLGGPRQGKLRGPSSCAEQPLEVALLAGQARETIEDSHQLAVRLRGALELAYEAAEIGNEVRQLMNGARRGRPPGEPGRSRETVDRGEVARGIARHQNAHAAWRVTSA